MWLGAALTLRWNAGGARADRERAESLLREARDPATVLGAAVSVEHRTWAAFFLVGLLSPLQPQPGLGSVPDMSAYVEWMQRVGPAGMMSAARELHELLEETAGLPLPPEHRELLGRMRQGSAAPSAAPSAAGMHDLLASMVPDGDPFSDRLRQLLDRMFGTAAAPAPNRDPDSDPHPGAVPDPATALDPDAVRRIAAGLDAVHATTYGLQEALNSTDPHRALNDLLGRLGDVQEVHAAARRRAGSLQPNQ
ncbi:hypothetical protein ATKI12_4276 [Kitasatospora sp. Ki12]